MLSCDLHSVNSLNRFIFLVLGSKIEYNKTMMQDKYDFMYFVVVTLAVLLFKLTQ